MTQVRSRFAAVIAALALAVGCALVATAPQSAYADDLRLGSAVGGNQAAATNMPMVGKSLYTTAFAEFNDYNDNHFYRFTTSNRNSTYRIKLQADSADGMIFFTIYDSSMHRFYTTAINGTFQNGNTTRTIRLRKLKHNTNYYVEVWRLAVDAPWYVINDNGSAIQQSYERNAAYRLTIRELITAPDRVRNFHGISQSNLHLRVRWRASHYADGYQLLLRNNVERMTKNYYFNTKNTVFSLKTKYNGVYRVWVRPYRLVNGKKYYGAWSPGSTRAFNNGLRIRVKPLA